MTPQEIDSICEVVFLTLVEELCKCKEIEPDSVGDVGLQARENLRQLLTDNFGVLK